MRLSFLISIACSIFCMLAGRAEADSQGSYCHVYAARAVVQNQRNFQNHCGYTGNRWGDSASGHYQWCLRLPRDGMNPYFYAAGAEEAAREKALRQCKAPSQPNVPFVKPGSKAPPPPGPVKGDCPTGWYKSSDGQCYQRLN